jgi:hypothetical protein
MSGRRAGMKSVGDAPCTRPQRLSTLHGDPVQVKRIGSSAQVWQATTLAIGAARFRRSPPQDFRLPLRRQGAVAARTVQSAAAQAFPDVTQSVQEQSVSTLG